MNKNKLFIRGSEWRKWDLQIQPIKDEWFRDLENKKVKIKNSTKDFLIEACKKNINVVAITDHNTGISIDLAYELLAEHNLNLYVLPGVEIETPEGWHCLVIFNPVYKETVHCKDWYDTVNAFLRNICKIKKGFFNVDGTSCQVNTHTKDLIQEIVTEDIGIFIFSHCDSNRGFFKRGNSNTRKEIIVENLGEDLYFVFDTKNGKREEIEEKIRNITGNPEYKLSIPVISSSDAHQPRDLGRFTWIKADPTYTGLKQILFEPKFGERTFIDDYPPVHKNASKIIDKITISNSKNWFGKKSILFNENMVTIIGEKGSGKTALADFLAFAGGDFNRDETDQSSFIYKALKVTKQINETIDNCKITIHWKNNKEDPVVITKDLKEYQASGKVKYLSQSFIEKKCRPENFNELQKEFEDIIFQHIDTSDRLGKTTFKELRLQKTNAIEIKKDEYKQKILDFNNKIFKSKNNISSLQSKKEEKKKFGEELKELEQKKPKPTKKKEKEIEEKLSILNNHKNHLESKIANLKSFITTIESIKTEINVLKKYVKDKTTQIEKDITVLGLKSKKLKLIGVSGLESALDKKNNEIEEEIIKLIEGEEKKDNGKKVAAGVSDEPKLKKITNNNIKNFCLNKTKEWITKLESKSTIMEATREKIKEFDDKILKINKRIEDLDKNIAIIEKLEIPELPKMIDNRNKAYKDFFELLSEEKETLEELYSPLKSFLTKSNKKNQLEFFARIELDVNNFFKKACMLLDFSRKGRYRRDEEKLNKKIKKISEAIELGEVDDIAGEMFKFYETFEKDEDGEKTNICDQLTKGKTILDFYNWFFDIVDFKVAYNIKYQGTSLELLSPGKKGIVLLLMYLVLDTESSIPLIIDQPEENLDNKSVFPSLVNCFREIKKRRQVFVITHNPNLVLNTDAEQIIVAGFDASMAKQPSRITYVSGAIENSAVSKKAKIPLEKRGIRDHGLDILEGGKSALKKRLRKWECK